MKVYELIQKLLEAPAGANVYIKINDYMNRCDLGDEVLMNWAIKDKDGNFILTTKLHQP